MSCTYTLSPFFVLSEITSFLLPSTARNDRFYNIKSPNTIKIVTLVTSNRIDWEYFAWAGLTCYSINEILTDLGLVSHPAFTIFTQKLGKFSSIFRLMFPGVTIPPPGEQMLQVVPIVAVKAPAHRWAFLPSSPPYIPWLFKPYAFMQTQGRCFSLKTE